MVEDQAAVFTSFMLAIALIAICTVPPRSSTAGASLIVGQREPSDQRKITLASDNAVSSAAATTCPPG